MGSLNSALADAVVALSASAARVQRIERITATVKQRLATNGTFRNEFRKGGDVIPFG
jgi:hypothetical protein